MKQIEAGGMVSIYSKISGVGQGRKGRIEPKGKRVDLDIGIGAAWAR